METFTDPKDPVENPRYGVQRQNTLAGLSDDLIDGPVLELIRTANRLPFCFTIQSCWGHFVYSGQSDPRNLAPLPVTDGIGEVEYRIAYICLCVECSVSGIRLLEALKALTAIDPHNIQFGCAEWFWSRQINSYALQVQPERFKHKDTAIIGYREALHLEKIRNRFFEALGQIFRDQPATKGCG